MALAGGCQNGMVAMAGGVPNAMMSQNGMMAQNSMSCMMGQNGVIGQSCMFGTSDMQQSMMQVQLMSMGQTPGMGSPMNMGVSAMSPMGMPMMVPSMMPMQPNPLLAGMMMGGGAVLPRAEDQAAQTSAPEPVLDPEVKELGDYFDIEDRWVVRLDEAMAKRKATKESDMAKLWEVLESAVEKTGGNPTGLLTVKIGEMESGRFVGKRPPDEDVAELTKRFKLDGHVESRITEMVVLRPETRDCDVARLEKFLKYSKRPPGSVMILVGKLLNDFWEALPDLSEAEAVMRKFKLDSDACSKLAEIVFKRSDTFGCYPDDLLNQLQRHLETSANPSAMLCKLASKVIDGQTLPDPTERSQRDRPANDGRGNDRSRELSERREKDRGHDRERSRDRDRGTSERPRSRDRRDRERSRSRSRRRS